MQGATRRTGRRRVAPANCVAGHSVDQPIAETRRRFEAVPDCLFDQQARHEKDGRDAAHPDDLIEEETGEGRIARQNRDDDDCGGERKSTQNGEPVPPPRHQRTKAIGVLRKSAPTRQSPKASAIAARSAPRPRVTTENESEASMTSFRASQNRVISRMPATLTTVRTRPTAAASLTGGKRQFGRRRREQAARKAKGHGDADDVVADSIEPV